jgi:hypothetical protein
MYHHAPEEQYAVVHAAFECMFMHSVFTSWHRMEYMDDPADISDCKNTVDWSHEKFLLLNHDNNDPLPVP